MAILTDVPGLNIEIRARGQELAEHYPDEEECHSKTVTKYIEAVTNEEFEVSLSVPKHFKFFEYDLAVQVYLDGEFADALVLKEVEMRKGLHTRIGGVKRYDGLKWQQRNFRFAHLQTSEAPLNGDQLALREKVNALGEITVKLHRCRYIGNSHSQPKAEKGFTTIDLVPEKALKGKAVSHKVTLGNAQSVLDVRRANVQYIDSPSRPFANFRFRYRSREALKAMLIIPPSPSPTPLDELELEDLTAAEMRELLRRERASYLSTVDVNGTNRSQEENAALRAVKREPKRTYGGTITDDDDEVQVTQERSAKRTRLSLNDDSGIDVVDLTQ